MCFAIDFVHLRPPKKNDGAELIFLQENGPAALSVIAVSHRPAIASRFFTHERGPMSWVELVHLEDDFGAGRARREFDAVAVAHNEHAGLGRKDLVRTPLEFRLSLPLGLQAGVDAQTEERAHENKRDTYAQPKSSFAHTHTRFDRQRLPPRIASSVSGDAWFLSHGMRGSRFERVIPHRRVDVWSRPRLRKGGGKLRPLERQHELSHDLLEQLPGRAPAVV